MELNGKVAVITGAASGIGLGLAEQAASRGMKLVLADVEEAALRDARGRVAERGATALAVPTDVRVADEVEALATAAFDEFGSVDLLCNNAGVNLTVARPVWEFSPDDWEWVIGVNMWGVIHGLRAFLPRMMEQSTQSHILNTASSAGLISGPGLAIYKLTKHAVLSLSETMFHDLKGVGARVGVSVFCPGVVKTGIREASRNRPTALGEERPRSADQEAVERMLRESPGISGSEAGEIALRSLESGLFYIFTDPSAVESARERLDGIEAGVPPSVALTFSGPNDAPGPSRDE
ncbi:MAG: SDR family NAD(P)-dependent oxidoreductase [Deltaproteobacteria bacterium]|nr:SDR family NAD(P)-dependent oxidoreductase [Deltaproteobacteria bacterium]